MASRDRQRRQTCAGFSLIEMLVAMSVIGLLVALLLPAVFRAREAARLAACLNNMRQLGIALHNYHEVHSAFPIGVRSQRGFGPSWFVGILPYIDQAALYNEFDMDSANNGAPFFPGSRNGILLDRKVVPVFWCPSSILLQMLPASGKAFQASAYVGVAGATNDFSFPAQRVTGCCVTGGNTGQISADGMLVPGRSIRMADVKDGESNVMIVAEASAAVLDNNNVEKRVDGGYLNGWSCGTSATGTPPYYYGTSMGSPPPQAYNIVTIRYPPNSSYSQPGVWDNHGPNNPLSSMHRGGVSLLLLDSSARFVSENIELDLLKRLAVRDDGQALNSF